MALSSIGFNVYMFKTDFITQDSFLPECILTVFFPQEVNDMVVKQIANVISKLGTDLLCPELGRSGGFNQSLQLLHRNSLVIPLDTNHHVSFAPQDLSF